MTLWKLSQSARKRIWAGLPDVTDVEILVLSMPPDTISSCFDKSSTVPIASVCLKDCIHVVIQARYALAEAYASLDWFRGKSPYSNEENAVFFGRFYADDVAVRLYAAQEHLANAVIAMLEISKSTLKPHQKKLVSKASVVGAFLRKERPNDQITKAALKLFKSIAWKEADRYRGRWTHEQSPTIGNFGEVWKRDKRWRKIQQIGVEAYSLGIGSGDEPDYRVDTIIKFLHDALAEFVLTVRSITDAYVKILKARGINANGNANSLKWTFPI